MVINSRCPGCQVWDGYICKSDCPEYLKRQGVTTAFLPQPPPSPPPSSFATQVGGDHYKSLAIQPIEYITKNNLGWCEGNIVKYITRWKQKGGEADIDKVIHYANLLKELNNNNG